MPLTFHHDFARVLGAARIVENQEGGVVVPKYHHPTPMQAPSNPVACVWEAPSALSVQPVSPALPPCSEERPQTSEGKRRCEVGERLVVTGRSQS